jgi:hypothetical protein
MMSPRFFTIAYARGFEWVGVQRLAGQVISVCIIELTKVFGKPQTAWGCPATTRRVRQGE